MWACSPVHAVLAGRAHSFVAHCVVGRYSGSLDRAGLTHTSVAAISGVMSSAKARGGEASAGGSSPGSRKPATAASAGAGAGAGTHPQAPQHRQPASHAAGGAMPAAGPPRHSDGRRGAGTPTSSQASGAPPSRSGVWRALVSRWTSCTSLTARSSPTAVISTPPTPASTGTCRPTRT